MKHLEQDNILCTQQHGFRKHRSCECETQLLELVEDLMENMEGGRQTEILIMDFVKALNKVNHSLLLHKLHHHHGCPPLAMKTSVTP